MNPQRRGIAALPSKSCRIGAGRSIINLKKYKIVLLKNKSIQLSSHED
jgi:hypothetical protein